MRKVTFGGANSLGNYFARFDGGMDWLLWSEEAMELTKDFWPTIDTIIMGRKTYDVAMASQENKENRSGGEEKSVGEDANPHGGIKTYVFSKTKTAGKSVGGAEIVNEDPGVFVRNLKKESGKDICILGGGDLARSLFEAGVIDEIGLNIHPVLLGSGVPLFYEMSRQIDLELLECKPLKNGCVYVLYRVKK